MAERYEIPDDVLEAIAKLRSCRDLIELNFALGDLGVEVSDLIRVASQQAKVEHMEAEVEDMEAEVEHMEARERWMELDPELRDALVRAEFEDLPITSDAAEADAPA